MGAMGSKQLTLPGSLYCWCQGSGHCQGCHSRLHFVLPVTSQMCVQGGFTALAKELASAEAATMWHPSSSAADSDPTGILQPLVAVPNRSPLRVLPPALTGLCLTQCTTAGTIQPTHTARHPTCWQALPACLLHDDLTMHLQPPPQTHLMAARASDVVLLQNHLSPSPPPHPPPPGR